MSGRRDWRMWQQTYIKDWVGTGRWAATTTGQLWKLSFKELMLDNWVIVLRSLGIKKQKANAMLQHLM